MHCAVRARNDGAIIPFVAVDPIQVNGSPSLNHLGCFVKVIIAPLGKSRKSPLNWRSLATHNTFPPWGCTTERLRGGAFFWPKELEQEAFGVLLRLGGNREVDQGDALARAAGRGVGHCDRHP